MADYISCSCSCSVWLWSWLSHNKLSFWCSFKGGWGLKKEREQGINVTNKLSSLWLELLHTSTFPMFIWQSWEITEACCLITWSPAQESFVIFASATCRSHAWCSSFTRLLHVVFNREDSDWWNRHQQIASSYSPLPTVHYSPGSNIVQWLHPVGVCQEEVTSSFAWHVWKWHYGAERDGKGKKPF